MTPEARAPWSVRLSLRAKLALPLAVAGVFLLAYLWLFFAPRTEQSFLTQTGLLVEHTAEAMREQAEESTARNAQLLVDLVSHTTDARRRVLADLPLTLYAENPDRLKEAVLGWDAERSERIRQNVAVLSREMQRRQLERIDAHLKQLAGEQASLGATFAKVVSQRFFILSGAVFLALLLWLGFGLYRTVVRPVRRLRELTLAVTEGNLDLEVPASSEDEVGELTRDFSQMMGELRRSRSEIREKNAQLSQWNETLEAEIGKKTRHLEEALSDLTRAQRQLVHAEKMASIGTLARGIAHEFNNLISGIRGCARVAGAAEDDSARREALDVIQRAAERGANITAQLLHFSRQRIGQMRVADVAGILGDALQLVAPEARRRGVETEVAVEGSLTAAVNAGALHQVFLNLLTNALQAMPGGGVLKVRGRADRSSITVEVEDGGVGIPEEHLDQVFDPFFTSKDDAADPADRGSGLGLSVSYGVVQAHGGSLTVKSRPGEGTVFTVLLPRRREGES